MGTKRRREAEDGPANAAPKGESAPNQKKRRAYTEQDAKLAGIYNNLASEVKEVRLQAGKDLITILSPQGNPDDELITKALTRLVRGLCSSRRAARYGFSIALTELVRLRSGLKPAALIELIDKSTQPDGKASGQERRDHLLGRLFAYAALIQSLAVFNQGKDDKSWEVLLDAVLPIAKDTVWLRGQCGSILCDAVKRMDEAAVEPYYVETLLEKLVSHNLAKTPEGVAVWLTVRKHFPSVKMPANVWKEDDPLSSKERTHLANVMKGMPDEANGNGAGQKDQTGTAQHTVSFAWDVILGASYEQHKDGLRFKNFWTDVVDNSLFASSASTERKSWGFQVFCKAVASAPRWALAFIFSEKLVRSLVNQQNNSERYLHGAAKAALDAMKDRVKRDPGVADTVVAGLMGEHGALNFDQLTKTRTVEGLLVLADDEALVRAVNDVKKLIYRPETDDKKANGKSTKGKRTEAVTAEIAAAADAKRRYLADLLVSVVRGRSAENVRSQSKHPEAGWLHEILLLFTELGYFTQQHPDSPFPPPSAHVQEAYRSRLSSCLSHILSTKSDETNAFPSLVLRFIRKETKWSDRFKPIFDADKDVTAAVKKAHGILDDIAKREKDAEAADLAGLSGLKLLYCFTLLQVYNQDADAVSVLDDLDDCYQSLSSKGPTDTSAVDVLVEVILGFIARPSTLSRKLAEQVFTAFAHGLTASGLQSTLDILSKKEGVAGQQELFDQADDEDMDMDDDEDDLEELGSDVEVISGAEGSSEENQDEESGDENSEADEDDDGEEDEQEDDEELAAFDKKLAEVLQTAKPGEDDEEDSDADMDDDEMLAIEPALVKVFQERQKASGKKKENKDAKETVINFKNRVLDLLLLYVKSQYANAIALDIILPLINLIRTTTSKQVAEKAFNLLKSYYDMCSRHKVWPKLDDPEPLWEVLADIHKEVAKDASKLHANACSRSSLFVIKVLVSMDEANYSRAVDQYSETQKNWWTGEKSKIVPSLFTEWISWSISVKQGR